MNTYNTTTPSAELMHPIKHGMPQHPCYNIPAKPDHCLSEAYSTTTAVQLKCTLYILYMVAAQSLLPAVTASSTADSNTTRLP
jgi:hypothetical protein